MLEEQVKAALENVRPNLQADGGDVEFVAISDDGVVSVKLLGRCGSCPMSQMTLKMGIESYLKDTIPQVASVVSV
ncbi:MAG: NifU family protein [Treponema sp.]|nr:NifU family protein [Treponema sp.]